MSPLSPARPQLLGTVGAVTSTHWLASHAGMAMLDVGGTAADAAAAAGFVLQLVEPHMCGPGGDLPVIVGEPDGGVHVICGQGPVPERATVAEFRRRGLDRVPGSGVLAAVVPGAFGGWMTLIERWGRLRPRDVLAPAVALAAGGFPLSPESAAVIGALADHFRRTWPSSATTWLAADGPPVGGQRWRLPALAETWQRLLAEAEGDGSHSREAECARARDSWHEGFVAAAVDAFCTEQDGLLTSDDMSSWRPTLEAPVTYDYAGWTVCKAPPWSQGAVFLQQLALLRGFDLATLPPDSADFVHIVTECTKLAFADREAWYGDPDFVDVPLATLLSDPYNDERRRLVDLQHASDEFRPGAPAGREPRLPTYDVANAPTQHAGTTGEPTLQTARAGPRDGDTVHLDVVDADGLMISATPSGGWLQSSPVIPALGFCLGSRAQMLWVEDGLAGSVAPRKRPRTTLTPTLALRDGRPALAFGTPGGDQQDQWSLQFFLRHAHGVRDLQRAVDAPTFHSEHAPSSFWPRQARPGRLVVEGRYDDVVPALRDRGHHVEVVDDFALGRVTAVADDRRTGGWVRAAATSRGRQAYAVAR